MLVKTNTHNAIEVVNPMTYSQYYALLEKLVVKKSTTGGDQSEEKVTATNINFQRMKRIAKTAVIDQGLVRKLQSLKYPSTWLIITEAWCGDASQNIPIINKVCALSKGKIQAIYVLRDENPELINAFLTNGTKSIPKLICLDSATGETLASWGPRPASIQKLLSKFKSEHPDASHKEIHYQVHLAYSQDKGWALQAELSKLADACRLSVLKSEIHH